MLGSAVFTAFEQLVADGCYLINYNQRSVNKVVLKIFHAKYATAIRKGRKLFSAAFACLFFAGLA
jgi:hypothetical protein